MKKDIAAKDRDQKIRDGILVYSTILMMPYARTVPGLWESFLDNGFYDLHEMVPGFAHPAPLIPVNAMHYREWRRSVHSFEDLALLGGDVPPQLESRDREGVRS